MADKGITPVLALLILVLITVAVVGLFYALTTDLTQNEREEDLIEYKDITLDVYGTDNSAYVWNWNNKTPINVTFYQGGRLLNSTEIAPNSEQLVNLNCVATEPNELRYLYGEYESKKIIEQTKRENCIEITDTEIITIGDDTYKKFKAKAYLNDREETPYANKDVKVKFDDFHPEDRKIETVETDSEGKFETQIEWDLPIVNPNSKWNKEINFESETDEVRFHAGKGKFQPPNRVRLEFEDGTKKVYQTQQVMKGPEGNSLNQTFDIVPDEVNSDSIKFNVSVNLEAEEELANDWNNHKSDSKLLYQIPLPEGGGYWSGPYTKIESISCSTGSDVTCSTGETSIQLKSGYNGKQFDHSSLPEDGGNKYIPVKQSVETDGTGNPFVGGLDPDYRIHHGGSTHNNPGFTHKGYRLSHPKRMVYVPKGEEHVFWDNMSLNSIRSDVDGIFGPGKTINTTYVQDQRIVSGATGWWTPPSPVSNQGYFSLEKPVEFSGSDSSSGSIRTVLYEWQDVTEGDTYDLNFTVQLKREPSQDRHFMLPLHLGTLGLFPENGGEARPVGNRYGVYTKGMVRYPPYRETGSIGFYTTVPGQSSSRDAVVYKTTVPKKDQQWESNTYVLNTGSKTIENIYLLNSRGNWSIHQRSNDGDNKMSPGEVFEGELPLDPAEGEKVALNLQYQTITGSQTAPAYDDTEYDFGLTVRNGSAQNYDISGEVNCRPRFCFSYRVGNREEARPISQLSGNSAPQSVFTDNISKLEFRLQNNVSDPTDPWKVSTQRLKEFKFWVWYMKPYRVDLEGEIDRIDNLTLKTVENGEISPGRTFRDFE